MPTTKGFCADLIPKEMDRLLGGITMLDYSSKDQLKNNTSYQFQLQMFTVFCYPYVHLLIDITCIN